MKAMRRVAILPIRAYQWLLSPMIGDALQVLPLVLGIRRAGGQAIRHTARTRPGRLAAAALQPMESRRL